jgi:tail tube protein
MTKLEAVNRLLVSIGQDRIATLPSANPTEDENAAVFLIDQMTHDFAVSRNTLYNVAGSAETIYEKTLTADGAGKITLPSNTIRVSLHPEESHYETKKVVERDDGGTLRLYSLTDESFTIWGALATVKVQITYGLDFTLLPGAARRWIAAKAKVDFLEGRAQSTQLGTRARADEQEAWYQLQKDEHLRNPSTCFDNYSSARPILRPTMIVGP